MTRKAILMTIERRTCTCGCLEAAHTSAGAGRCLKCRPGDCPRFVERKES